MPLQLSLATEADISLLVPIQFAAFHPENRVHRLIYPSPLPVPDSIINTTISRHLESWKGDPHVTWIIIRDTESLTTLPSGEKKPRIIAAAKWIIWPAGESPTWPEKIDVNWIPDTKIENTGNVAPNGAADDKAYVSYVLENFFDRRRKRITGSAAILDVCFTDPEYHRRGAGKMLVNWGTAKADELGIRAFVEASPEGRRLYESCGFEVVEEVELRGNDEEKGGRKEWEGYGVADWIFMCRPAKKVE
jgi:GNAT superfamily N-acetyltransferase